MPNEIEDLTKGITDQLNTLTGDLKKSMDHFKEMSKESIPDSVRTVGNMVVARHGVEVRIKFTTDQEAKDHIQTLIDNAS